MREVHVKENKKAIDKFSKIIEDRLRGIDRPIVFLCIGTDKSTGDSLGPLVGTFLKQRDIYHVYGDLEKPAHWQSYRKMLTSIEIRYDDPFIIVIDACLSNRDRIGTIAMQEHGIRPGNGVGKQSNVIGDISIIGIVNEDGELGTLLLKSTSLAFVYNMAEIIADSIATAMENLGIKAPKIRSVGNVLK